MALTRHSIALIVATVLGAAAALAAGFFLVHLVRWCRRRRAENKPKLYVPRDNENNRLRPGFVPAPGTAETGSEPATKGQAVSQLKPHNGSVHSPRGKPSTAPQRKSGASAAMTTAPAYPGSTWMPVESRPVVEREQAVVRPSDPHYPTNVSLTTDDDDEEEEEEEDSDFVELPEPAAPRSPTVIARRRRDAIVSQIRQRKISRSAPSSRRTSPTRPGSVHGDAALPAGLLSDAMKRSWSVHSGPLRRREPAPRSRLLGEADSTPTASQSEQSQTDSDTEVVVLPAVGGLPTFSRDPPMFPLLTRRQTPGPQGLLHFQLSYVASEGKLRVQVFSADLLPRNTHDPVVKVSVLSQSQTTISVAPKRATADLTALQGLSQSMPNLAAPKSFDPCNPYIMQMMTFTGIDSSRLATTRLRISVHDRKSRLVQKTIGEVLLSLHGLNLAMQWKAISLNLECSAKFAAKPRSPCGELAVYLQFVSAGAKLQCRVIKALNLPQSASNDSYGVYVSVKLKDRSLLLEKRKTPVVLCDRAGSAMFNFDALFNLDGLQHNRIQLELTVKARLTSLRHRSLEIGKIILGANAGGETQRQQWHAAEELAETFVTHLLHT